MHVYGGQVFLTVSMLPKVHRPDGLLTSAVYRFRLDDENIELRDTLADPNLLVAFVTRNRDCQYGADGLVLDGRGNLFVGNFGDGAIHKVTFDRAGRVTGNSLFAEDRFQHAHDRPRFSRPDGPGQDAEHRRHVPR